MPHTRTLIAGIMVSVAVAALACDGDRDVGMRFTMEGKSMEPTLCEGDTVDVIDYLDASPQHGDIIGFDSPTSPGSTFLKRIIGTPGDTVEIDQVDQVVRLNGDAIDEPYIRGPIHCRYTCKPLIVPDGAYFVLGDNRGNSSDSTQGWLLPEENIIGWVEEWRHPR